MNSKKILIGLIAFLALSLSAAFTVFSFIKETAVPRLPELGQVQAFVLQDAEGKEFHSNRLNGKVWIADFFFTTCGGVCPMMSKNMAALSRTFEQLENIQLVSITVNPEQDTSQALARYAEQFKGSKKNWHFLTGSREAITGLVVGSFKLGDIREPVFHSTYFPLVDSRGKIRGYYDGTKEEEVNRLFKDAAALAKERK